MIFVYCLHWINGTASSLVRWADILPYIPLVFFHPLYMGILGTGFVTCVEDREAILYNQLYIRFLKKKKILTFYWEITRSSYLKVYTPCLSDDQLCLRRLIVCLTLPYGRDKMLLCLLDWGPFTPECSWCQGTHVYELCHIAFYLLTIGWQHKN